MRKTKIQKAVEAIDTDWRTSLALNFANRFGVEVETYFNLFSGEFGRLVTRRMDGKKLTNTMRAWINGHETATLAAMDAVRRVK